MYNIFKRIVFLESLCWNEWKKKAQNKLTGLSMPAPDIWFYSLEWGRKSIASEDCVFMLQSRLFLLCFAISKNDPGPPVEEWYNYRSSIQQKQPQKKKKKYKMITLVLVSKAPRPQNVPPPMELPPIRSNLSSDSTCKHTVLITGGAITGNSIVQKQVAKRNVDTSQKAFEHNRKHTWGCINWDNCLSSWRQAHLHYGDSRADVDEQVREDVRVRGLESELGLCMLHVHKRFMRDVLQDKVTAFNETGHLVLLVNSDAKKKKKETVSS